MTGERRVLVIGSGPAAAAAALTLLEHHVPVIMLESGLPIDHGLVVRALGRNLYRRWPTIQPGYDFTVSGDQSTRWLSALAPGGLSNLWTGAVPRFAPDDFREGQRLHERYRWPITYEDLAPYYTRMERLLGVVGERRGFPQLPAPEAVEEHPLARPWRQVARHAEAFGQGMVRVPLADGPRWMVRRSGHAFNSFQGIVRTLRRFPDFQPRFGAHVVQLHWNPQTSRVDSVIYVDRSTGETRQIQGAAVVVAAGPLASTKLLLQSTSSDFTEGMGNRHGVLGCFLHDHPNEWSVLELDSPLPVLDHNVYLTRLPYTELPPLMGASVIFCAISKSDRLLSLTPRTTRRFGVLTFSTTTPTQETRVRLHPERKDEFGFPVLDIRMQFGPEVRSTLQATYARLQAILEAAGYHCTLTRQEEDLFPGYSAHYGGTVRMHESPAYGVLNAWSRLHDVPNVVVADASAFTTGVEKNPTLTVMALSARAADRLADDLMRDNMTSTRGSSRALPAFR